MDYSAFFWIDLEKTNYWECSSVQGTSLREMTHKKWRIVKDLKSKKKTVYVSGLQPFHLTSLTSWKSVDKAPCSLRNAFLIRPKCAGVREKWATDLTPHLSRKAVFPFEDLPVEPHAIVVLEGHGSTHQDVGNHPKRPHVHSVCVRLPH